MSDSKDAAIIAVQLGRAQRARSTVVARCPLQLPVVLAVPPRLDTGEPFPTRYWLSCPLAHKRIARLEADGEVRRFEEKRSEDPVFAEALAEAHRSYAEERDALVSGEGIAPRGGVAGIVGGGVKCLHAHYAHQKGGGTNPIGAEVMARIEPLNCAEPCVCVDTMQRNPAWQEPPEVD